MEGSSVSRIERDNGAALVIAMMVLVICALLGAVSILTTNTDMQVAVNDRVYREALMNADAGIQWLRQQDLKAMAGYNDPELAELNAQLESYSGGVLFFSIPEQPTRAWYDPTAGGLPVYRVKSKGQDRNRRGAVTIEAEIRLPPGKGPIPGPGSQTQY